MADESEPAAMVPITSLTFSDSPRVGGEDPEHVYLLASTEAKLPPIFVHRPTMRVIDGRHRVAAALQRGEDLIEARFFDGSEADAFVLAVKSNIRHGLPLSLQDRKSAAARIIGTHPQWSDRIVASVTGLSARTIAEVRAELGHESNQPATRIGRDGRVRPLDSTEGRTLAAELLRENPELSLRQVAKRAGIAPETVRDVQRRLSLGLSPYRSQVRGPARVVPPPSGQYSKRSALMQRLQSDPNLQQSEAGKALLRLLMAHMSETDSWERMVDVIPAHRSGTVAELAKQYSRIWAEFADQIEGDVNVD